MSAPETVPARIPPGTVRELGPIGWIVTRLCARAIRAPRFHLLEVLGQARLLFLSYLPFAGFLLLFGRISRTDAEVVILRVGHLRNCAYELQQHRRLARSRGLDDATQAKIFEGPDAGLTVRQRVLVTAPDEFVMTRSMSDETWAALSDHFDRSRIVEFCMLASNYDGLAATITTLRVPLDFPE